MKTLREVDFLFIDDNKTRIRARRDGFLSQGKQKLFPKDAATEKVFTLCD